jgi:hypothetical protein
MPNEIYGVNPGRVNKSDKTVINWGDVIEGIKNYVQDNFLDSIGNGGSKFEDGVNTVTPDNGKYIFCIIPNETTVVNTMEVSDNWANYAGKQLTAGIPIYTKCTSIKLTSGSITLYQRSLS